MNNISFDKELYSQNFKKYQLSFLQSLEWAETRKPEWNPQSILLENEYPVTILTQKIPFIGKSYGYIPRPFNDQNFSPNLLKSLIEYTKENLHLTHLVVDPNILNSNTIKDFQNAGFQTTGKTTQPNYSNHLDLTQEEETLWMNFKSRYRRDVRKAEKIGSKFEFFTTGQEPFDRFWIIMEEVIKRTGIKNRKKEYFQKIWDIFIPQEMANIYIITKDGEDLGAYFVIHQNQMTYELYGGIKEEGKKIKTGYFLKWESIKRAKTLGTKLYDQWGVAKYNETGEYDKNDGLFLVSEFKQGFGGQNVTYLPQQTFIFDKSGYSISNKLSSIKKVTSILRKLG